MTIMEETKDQLLQPVCSSNPLVYMDISIGEENGKPSAHTICA